MHTHTYQVWKGYFGDATWQREHNYYPSQEEFKKQRPLIDFYAHGAEEELHMGVDDGRQEQTYENEAYGEDAYENGARDGGKNIHS